MIARRTLRKPNRSKNGSAESTEIHLVFRPPYDWQTIIRFYQSHPIPGVERVTGDSFERVFRVGNTIGFFQVQAMVDESQLKLRIVAPEPQDFFEVVRRVRKMFDLDSDPVLIANCFARVPVLAKLCDRFPGLRLPRGWDPFETAICSILGQLVSAAQRTNLVGQLVRGYGDEITHPVSGETTCLFPGPEVLAKCRSKRSQDDRRSQRGDSRFQPSRPRWSDFPFGSSGSHGVSESTS